MRAMVKGIGLAAALCLLAATANAATCSEESVEKKLAGAALKSHMKKCVTDRCNAQAVEKKLAGAAKSSFTKKCISDAAL